MRRFSTRMKKSKFKEIYMQYKASGLPKEEFCKTYGYTKSSFYYWLRKWGDGSDIRGHRNTSQLAPIMLIGNTTNEVGQDIVRPEQPGIRPSMELEIVHPTGLRIKMRGVIDLDVFKTLLNQF
jgi:transposase-like protein